MNPSTIVSYVAAVALSVACDASSAADPCSVAYKSATDNASFEQCRALAVAGDTSAQLGYGLILWSGYDREPNRSEALEWWRRAARQGYPLAQIALADFLGSSDLDPALRDDAEAYAWQSALGLEPKASALWKTLSPEQQKRAKRLAEEFKTKYVLPR